MKDLKELKLFLNSFEQYKGLPENYYLIVHSCINNKFPIYKTCNIEILHPLDKSILVNINNTKRVDTNEELNTLYMETLKKAIVEILKTLNLN